MLSQSLLKRNTLGATLHAKDHEALTRTNASMIAAYAAILSQCVLPIRSKKKEKRIAQSSSRQTWQEP